jgi:hypothetical protein
MKVWNPKFVNCKNWTTGWRNLSFWASPVSIIGWNSWLTRHDANFKKLTQWVQIIFWISILIFIHLCLHEIFLTHSLYKLNVVLQGVFFKPSNNYIVSPNLWFYVRDLKFWLLAYFLILLSFANFRNPPSKFIWNHCDTA